LQLDACFSSDWDCRWGHTSPRALGYNQTAAKVSLRTLHNLHQIHFAWCGADMVQHMS
jgi:hypothetical protein